MTRQPLVSPPVQCCFNTFSGELTMSDLFHSPLAEKYRPKTWTDVIGQDKVIGRIQALAQRGSLSGRAYWLSGQSGTGKTTIARLIAQDIADSFLIQEVDASALTVAQLKDLETESHLKGFGERSGRAFIVNEA